MTYRIRDVGLARGCTQCTNKHKSYITVFSAQTLGSPTEMKMEKHNNPWRVLASVCRAHRPRMLTYGLLSLKKFDTLCKATAKMTYLQGLGASQRKFFFFFLLLGKTT